MEQTYSRIMDTDYGCKHSQEILTLNRLIIWAKLLGTEHEQEKPDLDECTKAVSKLSECKERMRFY